MKCEVCKRAEASFYRYVASMGKQVPICAVCYQKVSLTGVGKVPLEILAKTLMNFQPATEFYAESEGKGRGVVCSNCGFEFEEYFEHGRLGCVKCYDVFHLRLRLVISKMHGTTRHNGSRPV